MNYILQQYDDNLSKILNEGFDIQDRTGVGCRVLYGLKTEVDISKQFPIPTKRKIFYNSVIKEWLWMVSGSDKISDLNKSGVKFWDYWVDDEFTGKNNFEKTSIGYSYGPNLRNFGGHFEAKHNIYDPIYKKGFDQLNYIVNEIKTNPNSRRIMFNLWRPDKLDECKLPPCMNQMQFIIEPNEHGVFNKLNGIVYQRSNDYFVGVQNSNLIGAGLYIYTIAQLTGLKPNKLIHIAGNAHIYSNHFEATKEYLSREPIPQPVLKINSQKSIDDYRFEDFIVENYQSHPAIKVDIAV